MGSATSVEIPGGGTEGYHILRVQDNSPASRAGIQSFFDFIVAINGIRLDRDNDTLKQVLKKGIGKQLPLTIYNSKTQTVRSVTVEPSETWGGQGLLGIRADHSQKGALFNHNARILFRERLDLYPNNRRQLTL